MGEVELEEVEEVELDEWERERLEELRQLRERWRKRARELLEEAAAARASGREIERAVELEQYVEMINVLFDNAEAKIYAAARARQRGEDWNEVIAAKEAATDIEMLRIYAKDWPPG
ncbi:MAG: hypothetical protein LM580_08605 [Thermofilum sp.]|nr:hypothetical protein [Thermofilum sp.]